jgi:hypothetical protein
MSLATRMPYVLGRGGERLDAEIRDGGVEQPMAAYGARTVR